MKQPINSGAVPPGGYCRYRDPDAGFVVEHPYFETCRAMAKGERLRRNLPIPYNWDAFFAEQFCKATPQGCIDVPDAPAETGPNWTQLAVNFGSSLTRWVKAGAPVVSWEGFKERHVKCAGDENTPQCPQFSRFSGTFITKCSKCGCSSVKLWMATEKCPIGKW